MRKEERLNNKLASLCKQTGQYNEIIECIKSGADPNSLTKSFEVEIENIPKMCPLHYAIRDPKKVKILLTMGANPNCQDRPTYQTPLQIAADDTQRESLAILLEHGADTELMCTKGYNALHSAIISAQQAGMTQKALEIVKLLLKYSANPDAKTQTTWDSGKTPLMLATRVEEASLFFEELLKAGANPNIKNDSGKTIVDLANPEEKEALKELIKKYGSMHIKKILEKSHKNELEII